MYKQVLRQAKDDILSTYNNLEEALMAYETHLFELKKNNLDLGQEFVVNMELADIRHYFIRLEDEISRS